MRVEQRHTYYLYEMGHSPDRVTLGHLVHGNYAMPTKSLHYSAPRMSQEELESWAEIRDVRGEYGQTDKTNYGVEVNVFGAGNFGVGFVTESGKAIVAEKGRRIELLEPDRFFETKILTDEKAMEKLRTWLSVRRSKYILKKAGGLRKPEIWCLTGFYELENAKSCVVHKKSPSIRVGIDSAAVAAICGAPVGCSVDVGASSTITSVSEHPGKFIWAAQFQLLTARYTCTRNCKPTTISPSEIQLYPDTSYSIGVLLGDEDETDVAGLEMQTVSKSGPPQDDLDEAYWEAYDKAEQRIMEDMEDR
ncbi:hypothetical protein KXV81_007867 [Aspergillus fumigatus]|nr:hypothetical protein KXX45_000576 [Aspergillus fumigatus]KAH1290087.1 hypothetical protein KXX30_006303 [Aspergillus fumigatus]KAH1358031.1 hypothetical protein KXX63_008770 [Aspergillus fumigatus]KAH1380911.1 hypothetical protein KXX50_007617 [Aspergillus fumigatus]KAH1427704.1 hypothetical protein KXX32_005627 [Aspergillus fumigatus]